MKQKSYYYILVFALFSVTFVNIHIHFQAQEFPINWVEIFLEIGVIVIIGLVLLFMIRRSDLKIQKSEQALLESQKTLEFERAQLFSIFNSIEDIIYVTDPRTNEILFVNKFCEDVFGYDPTGKLCYKCFQNLDKPCDFCTNHIILNNGGRPHQWEYHNPFVDRDFMITDRIIKWPDGRNVRFELALDISSLKKVEKALRESEEKYRTLVESADDAIFLVDYESGEIVDANLSAEELFEIPIDELIGKSHTELHPKGEEERYKKYFNGYYDNDWAEGNIYAVNKKGEKIPIQVGASKVVINNRETIIYIMRDITLLKKVENKLRKDKAFLKSAVDEKSAELARAERNLEHSKRLSDIGVLSATVAHELRNPLGVIKTAIYNIKKKKESEVFDNHISNIELKIMESDRIIENLLSYSHIKMPQYQDVDLCKLIDECIENLKAKHQKYDVAIQRKYSKKCHVYADSLHMNELFINILDNAYQAMKGKKGKIVIKVESDEKENKCVIQIKDEGVGIEKKDLKNIMDPFFTRKAKGIGLGLTVCNQVTSLHGGKLNFESKIDEGTIVHIELPIKKTTK